MAAEKEPVGRTPDALKREGDSPLAGSNQVLDAVWDWMRDTGSRVGSFVDRQKRIAWCDRAIRELREDRDASLLEIGREMYRAHINGEIAQGTLSGTDTFVRLCRRVEDLDTKIAAQEHMRSQIAAGDAERPRTMASTKPEPADAEGQPEG